MKLLFSWIGRTDLNCAKNNDSRQIGPIATALKADSYDFVFLLNNYTQEDAKSDCVNFNKWIRDFSSAEFSFQHVNLSSPTNHKEIYTYIRKFLDSRLSSIDKARITFHTSPGTPAMAFTWMILAPVYGARLIESSIEAGVQQVDLPFEISAYFLPDKEITRLSESKVKTHPAFQDIIHSSDIMKETIRKAQHVAPRNITVLIEGESGTGKELFARAIHESSPRKGKPFITVNCGAIPSELIESMLFGYVKGAFTGADKNTGGYFQSANSGTLFLDELGEISQKAQVALLRALQEDEITRVGSSKAEKVDVRIIAATNRNLLEEVSKGNFRADLFYRLAVACLSLPSLRERKEDISLLIDDALKKANERLEIIDKEKHKKFSDSAKKIMLSHSWPGNIRELYNTVMRATLWSSSKVISETDINQALFKTPTVETTSSKRALGNGFSIKDHLESIAKEYIEQAEKDSGGNKAKASRLLGFKHYQTYTNWKKKYIEEDKE